MGGRPAAEHGLAPGLAILTLILLTVLAVRMLGVALATTDLHYEEAQNWFWSREFAFGDLSRPPLFMWLMKLVTWACGDSEPCIRMPSPIIATASAFLVYVLAHRLYDQGVAFWSAIVYATLPAVSAFSMVAMPESLFALVFTAALIMLSIHFDRPTVLSGLGLGLVVGLGFYADLAMIYLPLCAALYLAATAKLGHILLRAPGTWAALALAVLVAGIGHLPESWDDAFAGWDTSAWVPRLNADSTLAFMILQFVLFGPILLFVLLRSVLARRSLTPRPIPDRFLLFHSVPILAALLVPAVLFRAKAHWTLPAFPAAAIFVTALLLRHNFQRLLMLSTGIHVAILAAIVTLGIWAERYPEFPYADRLMGWRTFADGLNRAAAVSDVKTVVLRGGDQVAEALYYLRDSGLEIRAFNPRGRRPANEFERLRSWAYGDTDPILLATGTDPSSFGVPLGAADRIGTFPVQSYLNRDRAYFLYRINPPTENSLPP